MTLVQMQYFQAVCQWGSFLKASEQLHVSQSAISLSIKNMEKEYNTIFFERDKNALRITEAGRNIQEEINSILEKYNHLEKKIQNMSMNRDYIRVGVSTLGGNAVFPLILSELKKQYPDMVVSTMEESTKRQFEMLDENLLDVIITHRRFETPEEKCKFDAVYGKMQLIRDRQAFCVNIKNPISMKESVTWEDIAGEPLILLKDNFLQTVSIKQRFAERGLEPVILQQTSQMYTVERYIEQNIASGFLPMSAVRYNSLIKPFTLNELPNRYVNCFWRKDRYQFNAVKKFLSIAKAVSQEYDKE